MKQTLFLCFFLVNQIILAANPKLSFFNEQESKDLKELFSDSTIIPMLQKMDAAIRMGMLDLTDERATIIKKLNEAEIPVVAWLLLPKEEGYWFHSGNWERAFERYEEIKKWGEESGVQFSGIGIDIEIDYTEAALFKTNKLKLLGNIIGRLYDQEGFLASKEKYKELIEKVRDDGYTIESYYIPFFRKETELGRTSLQQATRFMDLTTDKDIPMLYTSFIGNPYGTLKVLALDEKLEYVAIGSTGGGIDPTLPSMTWDDLAYDLRVIAKTTKEIHIFCLEASVEKGFFPQLVDFDFEVPITEYPEQEKVVQSQIERVMLISKVLSYPTLILLTTIFLLFLIVWLIFKILKKAYTSFA